MCKVELSLSRNKLPTAKINGIRYHSTYDPQREAIRFLENALGTPNSHLPLCLIIIGAGLGYLETAAKAINSSIKVINIHLCEELLKYRFPISTNSVVYSTPIQLLRYLKTKIAEFELPGLKVIEWPPANKLFPHKIKEVRETILTLTKEYSGNFKTTIALGKRWIKNSFLNFLFFDSPIKDIHFTNNPIIVITASGPTLEHSLSIIKKYRKYIFLIALPSSLPMYSYYEIQPDLLVLTDPGYYSIYHLSFYTRGKLNLLMPYSGVTGLWDLNYTLFPILQTNFFEIELAKKAKLKLLTIPSQGTVAATALNYSANLNPSAIVFAGLDLCFYDVFSHARISGSDYYFYLTSNKLHPYLTEKVFKLYSEKYIALKTQENNSTINHYMSEPLYLYSKWFSNTAEQFNLPLFRLNASPVKLRGFINIEEEEFKSIIRSSGANASKLGKHAFRIEYYKHQYPNFTERKQLLKKLIEHWLSELTVIEKTKITPSLLNDTFFNFAYYFDLKKLSELKQNIIENNYRRVRELVVELNDSIHTFLNKYLDILQK